MNISTETHKHKVFISFYHSEDQKYRDKFEELFGHQFLIKSAKLSDIESDSSDAYIHQLVENGYLTDSSILVVLIGPKTYCSKHVDWEISAALDKKIGRHLGLFGIFLPDFPINDDGSYRFEDLPPRLADNIKSGYAKAETWNWVCKYDARIRDAVETAFDDRIDKAGLIDNSRTEYEADLCS